MPFLPADMVREIGHFLDDKSFKNWRQTCSFFARETFNDLVKREKHNLTIKQAVACGGILLLKHNGTVWGYGTNSGGQLGLGNLNYYDEVTQIPKLTGIVQLSAGGTHTLLLKRNGTVWGCGYNYHGELGFVDNHSSLELKPIFFPELTEVAQVIAGSCQSAFLKKDGTVWMCGENNHGKLGLGDTIERYTPTQIPHFHDITQVSLGTYHALFLKKDGTVWGCGSTFDAQLGLGSEKECPTPVPIPGLREIIQVAAGGNHSVFLKKDGTVWVCGCNCYGALGLGDNHPRDTPTQIPNLSEITQIFASGNISVFQKKEGSVWGCGHNGYGELGLGHNNHLNTPTQISGLMHIEQVTFDFNKTLFLKKDGEVLVGGLLGGKLKYPDYYLHSLHELIPSRLNQIQTLEAYHLETKYMRKSL